MYTIKINELHEYSVYIGNQIVNKRIEKQFAKYEQIVFFIDNNITIDTSLTQGHYTYFFKAKEENKNITEYEKMIKFLLENEIGRKNSLIIAIGGGVTLDLVGYVASTYKRGTDVLYVPTSLLAMMDVAIGSKNTINIGNIKNAVGTFYSPKEVIIDLNFLKTLDQRNFNNGMAEVIKHGAIKDVNIIEDLLSDNYELLDIIYRSIKVKQYFIEQDNLDRGIRQSLNFGHTLGHALEAYYDYDKYLHGEAVSIGMNYMYENSKLKRVCQKFNLPIAFDVPIKQLIPLMKNDKKNENGAIKVIKLKNLGVVDERLHNFNQ